MAITVLELAIFRGAKVHADGTVSASAIDAVGLPFMGGCGVCGATVGAHNSCPSRSGWCKCKDSCIDGDGFDTVEEANNVIFKDDPHIRRVEMFFHDPRVTKRAHLKVRGANKVIGVSITECRMDRVEAAGQIFLTVEEIDQIQQVITKVSR